MFTFVPYVIATRTAAWTGMRKLRHCHPMCLRYRNVVTYLPLCYFSPSLHRCSVCSSPQAVQGFDIINFTVFSILKLYTQLTDMGRHVSLCWIPSHVGIKGNEMADKAAKEGIRSIITQSKIPPESFFPHISKLCMEEWQDSWDSTPTNKLFSIKPVLGKDKPHTSLCRRDETVITRLRIGHSRMTHSYLLSRESQPVCDHCKCHLTVKHMLLECPSTAVIRHKYFSSTTLKELFSNVDARCILDFTKESGFYQAI